MNRILTGYFVISLVLVGASVAVTGQNTGTVVSLDDLAYTGDGDVPTANEEFYLWQSDPHQFSVTVSSVEPIDANICLVTTISETDTHRELRCEDESFQANETKTITISIDVWPSNLTGLQEVHVQLIGENGSERLETGPLPLTVIQRGGDLDEDEVTNQREVELGTGLQNPDTDGDGLTDSEEVQLFQTSPTDTDTDGDGLSDRAEVRTYQTNPTQVDTDDDGLADVEEIDSGTDPTIPDTDGDGILDGAERNVHDTDPTNADTDGDGLGDEAEINDYETNPLESDTDGDGLTDSQEVNTYGSDPTQIDTDGDGLGDGAEIEEYQTDPTESDTDNDGLSDGKEVNTYETDPTNPDTDGDGLEDGAEVHQYGTNPNEVDTDGDGESDNVEVASSSSNIVDESTVIIVSVVVLVVTVLALLYLLGNIQLAPTKWFRKSVHEILPITNEADTSSESPVENAVQEVPAEFLANDERVLQLVEAHDGQIRQSRLVEETEWSKSKVSRVLAEMEKEGQIVKIDVGNRNVIVQPDDLPSGAESTLER